MPRWALIVALAALATQPIPQDAGAAGAWQKLLKVRNVASVMHVTAHPDDEHGGVLAKLSRGDGARVALLTLTRGESGDNAIGPQLFDALGLIRTEELLNAGRYYGIDDQYFTTVVDYGFSKRLEESIDKWGRDTVLRDVVRIVRMNRPWIILSRFQGNERDGHGNHSAAGVMAVEAFRAAADPNRFPEQIAEGLRPWQAYKVYIAMRENEGSTVTFDTSEYNPVLGDSYENIARRGLAFQRSQNGGRYVPLGAGPNYVYYARAGAGTRAVPRETSVFDGLPPNYEGVIGANGRAIDIAIARAFTAFAMTDPSRAAAPLADGLRLVREALTTSTNSEHQFFLRIKDQQFQDAINATLGLELTAFTDPPTMGAPVAGQRIEIQARLANHGTQTISSPGLGLVNPQGWPEFINVRSEQFPVERLSPSRVLAEPLTVAFPADAPLFTRPYFSRSGLNDSRYTLNDPSQFGKPVSDAPIAVLAHYEFSGVRVALRETVKRREPKLPYGDAIREVRNVPLLSVTMTPSTVMVPVAAPVKRVEINVALLHNANTDSRGVLVLNMPAGWTSTPESQQFAFTRAGERASYRFTVTPPTLGAQTYTIEAEARTGGRSYKEGYELIDQRDLEVRYLYRPATADVRGIDVTVVPGLKVGYVMGIGDQVPQGLQQLGAQVTLLGERDLASADLSQFDTIMTGTRAYAVREDLKTYNQRLLDYVKAGGNMVVLYNTQEFDPAKFAPYMGELPRTAEEVSEEDSPITILAPNEQSFAWPNKITLRDFDGWVEQRGSKFFTTWHANYVPMISTFDRGQTPQSGGWLTTKFGNGHWTYFAYALHRQLPYGVPGAYRITANLLALGKTPEEIRKVRYAP